VAFDKAKGVKPGVEQELTLAFGAAEMSRWVAAPTAVQSAPAPGSFAVVPGQYLLTVVDQYGDPAANLTLAVD
jgi:hypothetical protein